MKQYKNIIVQKAQSKIILGGEVEKRGSRLIWKVKTNDIDSIKTVISKLNDIVIPLSEAEIHLDKSLQIGHKIYFINKGIEKVEKEKVICGIEFINRYGHKRGSRFLNWRTTTKKEKSRINVLTELYKEESEDVETFAKSAERLIKLKQKGQYALS